LLILIGFVLPVVAASKLHGLMCCKQTAWIDVLQANCIKPCTLDWLRCTKARGCLLKQYHDAAPQQNDGQIMAVSQSLLQSLLATLPPPARSHRNPTKVNAAVIEKLSAEQAAALKAATQRSITYRLNKTTPDIYNHLISTVQQQGSLAGMLQAVGVPLCHLGYSLSAPAEGMDLQYMQLTAARAVQVMQQHVQQVHDGCLALGWQLPAKPARPVLLQCTPDLLCAD
jgi:hypothetical protein